MISTKQNAPNQLIKFLEKSYQLSDASKAMVFNIFIEQAKTGDERAEGQLLEVIEMYLLKKIFPPENLIGFYSWSIRKPKKRGRHRKLLHEKMLFYVFISGVTQIRLD